MNKSYTLLSLGDSYTCGEQVAASDNFPNQAVKMLAERGITFQLPEIIAVTGWTTDELMQAIETKNLQGTFDFVTLLIGVNNQYRGRDTENYRSEFSSLLDRAIAYAGHQPSHVIVLSIPDWGVTAFAAGQDRKKIAGEIDAFNGVNKEMSSRRGVQYLDITRDTREHPDWLAPDGLHPDARQYALWATAVAQMIRDTMAP